MLDTLVSQFAAGFDAAFGVFVVLLFLLSAGAWSAVLGGRSVAWAALAILVAGATGMVLAGFGLGLPFARDVGYAAALAIAVLLAVAMRLPPAAGIAIIAVAAGCLGNLFAGMAPASPVGWIGLGLGAVVAQAAGIGLAEIIARGVSPRTVRTLGLVTAALIVLAYLRVI